MIDGLGGEKEPPGDLGVVQTLRQECEYLDFAWGQICGIAQCRPAGAAGDATDAALVEPPGDDAGRRACTQSQQLGQRPAQA